MDVKIIGDSHNNLHPQYLYTGQTQQMNDLLMDEKAAVEIVYSFPETAAAVYEKREPSNFGIYSVNTIQSTGLSESALNSKMKSYLSDLGFYSGEMGGGYTEEFRKALKCFQKAYFGAVWYSVDSKVTDSLQREIETAGTIYYRNLTNSKLNDALKKLGFGSNPAISVKQNFARIQTFFERAMGCNKYQAAGIMGNIKQESNFDPKSDNGDGAFGILQWRDERKRYLKTFAAKNGYSSFGNMGIQLAFFRYEVSRYWGKGDVEENAGNSHLVDGWNTLKNQYKYSFYDVSDYFKKNIEGCKDESEQIRRDYSSIIYQAIC